MSEEQLNQDSLETTAEVQQEPVNPEREKAVQNGWNPNMDSNDPNYKGYEAFNKVGEQIKYTQHLSKKVGDLENVLIKMLERNVESEKETKEQNLENLKYERTKASSIGDATNVQALTEKIISLEQQISSIKNNPIPKSRPIEIDEAEGSFKQRNSDWYGKNQEMTKYATEFDKWLAQTTPGLSADEHLKKVEASTKAYFGYQATQSTPQKSFRTAPTVESGEIKKTTSSDDSLISQLPERDQAMIKALQSKAAKAGKTIDVQKYIRDLTTGGRGRR